VEHGGKDSHFILRHIRLGGQEGRVGVDVTGTAVFYEEWAMGMYYGRQKLCSSGQWGSSRKHWEVQGLQQDIR